MRSFKHKYSQKTKISFGGDPARKNRIIYRKCSKNSHRSATKNTEKRRAFALPAAENMYNYDGWGATFLRKSGSYASYASCASYVQYIHKKDIRHKSNRNELLPPPAGGKRAPLGTPYPPLKRAGLRPCTRSCKRLR